AVESPTERCLSDQQPRKQPEYVLCDVRADEQCDATAELRLARALPQRRARSMAQMPALADPFLSQPLFQHRRTRPSAPALRHTDLCEQAIYVFYQRRFSCH